MNDILEKIEEQVSHLRKIDNPYLQELFIEVDYNNSMATDYLKQADDAIERNHNNIAKLFIDEALNHFEMAIYALNMIKKYL